MPLQRHPHHRGTKHNEKYWDQAICRCYAASQQIPIPDQASSARSAMPRVNSRMPDKRTIIRAILILLCFDAIAISLIDFSGRGMILSFGFYRI